MSTITPNMNLVLSTIAVDSGLTWEQNLNASLVLVDQHNHTPGYGAPLNSNSLNFTSPLPLNNNAILSVASVTFTPQISTPAVNSLYVNGVDLYYYDGNADAPIQITLGGAVNATSSGISSGTATASFVTGVLVVNAASSTPANIQGASLLLGNNSSGSKFLTLSPPAAMASNISQTLPTIPAATSIMQMDSSGNMSATLVVDNATTVISSNTLKVGTIQTANIAANAVTRPKLASVGQQISSGSGNFNTSSATPVAVTNLSVTITTTGRPVIVAIISTPTSTPLTLFTISGMASTNTTTTGLYYIARGGVAVYNGQFPGGANLGEFNNPAFTIDPVAAGTYTYTVYAYVVTGAAAVGVNNMSLMAYEL